MVEKALQNKSKSPSSREFENILFWNLSDFDYRRAINLSKESDENLIKIQKEIVSFAKNDKIESKSFINKLNKIKNNFDEEVEKRVELLKEEKK